MVSYTAPTFVDGLPYDAATWQPLADAVEDLCANNLPLTISPPESDSSEHIIFNEGYTIYADNAGDGSDNTRFWMGGPDGGEFVIGPRSGSSFFDIIRLRTSATTGSAANAVLDEDLALRKSTSSLRYKQDVTTHAPNLDKVRRLRPVRFRDRGEVAKNPDARHYIGLIAEEVDALGLVDLVTYDTEGRPDAVQYDRLPVVLLSVIRDQDRRLQELQKRVDEMEKLLASFG